MRLSRGYGAVDPAALGTERQSPQDGAASVFSRRHAVAVAGRCSVLDTRRIHAVFRVRRTEWLRSPYLAMKSATERRFTPSVGGFSASPSTTVTTGTRGSIA